MNLIQDKGKNNDFSLYLSIYIVFYLMIVFFSRSYSIFKFHFENCKQKMREEIFYKQLKKFSNVSNNYMKNEKKTFFYKNIHVRAFKEFMSPLRFKIYLDDHTWKSTL